MIHRPASKYELLVGDVHFYDYKFGIAYAIDKLIVHPSIPGHIKPGEIGRYLNFTMIDVGLMRTAKEIELTDKVNLVNIGSLEKLNERYSLSNQSYADIVTYAGTEKVSQNLLIFVILIDSRKI